MGTRFMRVFGSWSLLAGGAKSSWVICISAFCVSLGVLSCGPNLAGSGGIGGGSHGDVTYATSECGVCVSASCGDAISNCGADPSCAKYWQCVLACPIGESGDAAASCEVECPKPEGDNALAAFAAVSDCRFSGLGASCEACGKLGTPQNPIFHQVCDMPPPEETNPCWICQDEHCCVTQKACNEDPGCSALVDCAQACPFGEEEKPCFLGCYQAFPRQLSVARPRGLVRRLSLPRRVCRAGGRPLHRLHRDLLLRRIGSLQLQPRLLALVRVPRGLWSRHRVLERVQSAVS